MKSISMAVVGCGDIAHIRYLYAISHRKEKFQIDAVYDRNPEVCQRTAKELGAQAENSLESLLAIAKIDTVIVTTYHPQPCVHRHSVHGGREKRNRRKAVCHFFRGRTKGAGNRKTHRKTVYADAV